MIDFLSIIFSNITEIFKNVNNDKYSVYVSPEIREGQDGFMGIFSRGTLAG